jgi:deoxyribonucleoside regulator
MTRESDINTAYVTAHLYYERKLTQEEIAGELGVSRPTVSRMLSRAEQEGIVHISVRDPGRRDSALEARVSETLGLDAVVVVPGSFKSGRAREILLARGALELLGGHPTRVNRMGLGWGRSVFAFVEAVEQGHLLLGSTVELVPLIGGSGQNHGVFQSNEIARRAAQALGARARLLYAPALVSDSRVVATLLREPPIRAVWEAWQELDVVIVGIGRPPDPSVGPQYEAEYLQDETLTTAAVGDVCARYFDADGRPAAERYDSRLVAIDQDGLKRTPLSIGMAGGREKVAGIVGAARARLINALVTDEETANMCLRIVRAA